MCLPAILQGIKQMLICLYNCSHDLKQILLFSIVMYCLHRLWDQIACRLQFHPHKHKSFVQYIHVGFGADELVLKGKIMKGPHLQLSSLY